MTDLERLVAERLGAALAAKASPQLLGVLGKLIELPRPGQRTKPRPQAGDRPVLRHFEIAAFHRTAEIKLRADVLMPHDAITTGADLASTYVDTMFDLGPAVIPGTSRGPAAAGDMEGAFETETAELRQALEAEGAQQVVLGWSCGMLFANTSVEALARVAESHQVGPVGFDTGGFLPASTESTDGRIRPYDLTVGAPGADGAGVRIAVIDGEPAPLDALRQVGPVVDMTTEGLGRPTQHATMIAGLLVGQREDYTGIAPQAMVLPFKTAAARPTRSTPIALIVDAVQSASRTGAQIINCSFSTRDTAVADALDASMETIMALGYVIVRSAGNDAALDLSRPCDARGLIVVGACDPQATTMASYSNADAVGRAGFVIAPGGEAQRPLIGLSIDAGRVVRDSGTSYAAALVSGLAARYISGGTKANPNAILAALRSNTVGALPAVLALP